MIRSTQHNLTYCNTNKVKSISDFIDEYRRVCDIILSDIWKNGYVEHFNGKTTTFDLCKYMYDLPAYIDYNRFDINTDLSARALSSLTTQLVGIIKAVTKKQQKRVYVFDKLCGTGTYNENLWNKIADAKITKPNVNMINPELSSKCIDIQLHTDNHFMGFIRLKSIGKRYGHIKIPIKSHRHSKKYESWNLKNSFLISKEFINLRWESDDVKKKEHGDVVGADQGKKTILSLSNSTTTPNTCIHGHSLESVIDKLCRKKRGSKAFKKAQEHRKNLINWSLNQLDFSYIKEFRLEEIINITYGRNVSLGMKYWTNTLIRDKVEDICIRNGVHFKLQSSTYRSQRCSECGFVYKSARKGKDYICANCDLCIDADINAAKNHQINLPDIPKWLVGLNHNRKGFFWKSDGFFDSSGVELRVPLDTTIKSNIN